MSAHAHRTLHLPQQEDAPDVLQQPAHKHGALQKRTQPTMHCAVVI